MRSGEATYPRAAISTYCRIVAWRELNGNTIGGGMSTRSYAEIMHVKQMDNSLKTKRRAAMNGSLAENA